MKTLIVVANASPKCRYWASEAKRTEGFRRYLPEHGWRTIVLVKDCNCMDSGAVDEGKDVLVPRNLNATWLARITSTLEDQGGAFIRLRCTAKEPYRTWLRLAQKSGWQMANRHDEREVFHLMHPYPVFSSSTAMYKRMLIPFIKALAMAIRRPEQDRIDWVSKGVVVGGAVARHFHADIIMGSYPGVQNLIVAQRIAAQMACPWIADFRDSVSRGWAGPRSDLYRVRALIKSARLCLYVTDEEAARDASLRSSRYSVVENGFFQEEQLACETETPNNGSRDRFLLTCVGTLYPERNLDVFWDGFLRLGATAARETVQFRYVGASWQEVEEAARQRGLESMCAISAPMSPEHAREITKQATVLVLPTNSVGLSGVPGAKLYEYLAAGRPILAVGGRDTYVENVLHRTGLGRLCSTADAVLETLQDWMYRWEMDRRLTMHTNTATISEYSRKHSVGKMAGELNQLAKAEP